MTDSRSNQAALRYAIKTAQRPGVTRDLPYGPDDLLWVGNSSTLVYGSNDAVLVDTFTSTEQNAELVDWVKSFDKNFPDRFRRRWRSPRSSTELWSSSRDISLRSSKPASPTRSIRRRSGCPTSA